MDGKRERRRRSDLWDILQMVMALLAIVAMALGGVLTIMVIVALAHML